MKNKADYSKYECPYSHLEKESGHELHGPEGCQDVYGVWCTCGFRAPVFYLDPNELGLKLKEETDAALSQRHVTGSSIPNPPEFPLNRVLREGVGHFCTNCGSTVSKDGFLGLFGEMLCHNEKCPNSKSKKNYR